MFPLDTQNNMFIQFSISLPKPHGKNSNEKVQEWHNEQIYNTTLTDEYDDNPLFGFDWQLVNNFIWVSICTKDKIIVNRAISFIQRYLNNMDIEKVSFTWSSIRFTPRCNKFESNGIVTISKNSVDW